MTSHSEFLTLFLRHQRSLRAFVGSLVRDRDQFDDVMQDVVLTLCEKFETFDRNRDFSCWARGVAANKVMQFRDRASRCPTPFSPEVIQAIVDAFDQRRERPEMGEALDQCLAALPETSREVLTGWYAHSWPIERIAERLSSTPVAAYKALQRLRAKLLECVQRRLASAAGESS
jgi:RNA polymerase sigma-70 factor (ECF subfamily)